MVALDILCEHDESANREGKLAWQNTDRRNLCHLPFMWNGFGNLTWEKS
jgi:hypothetical protein